MAVQTTRQYPTVYGGWIGGLIALLVLIACFVLWITIAIEPKEALLIGGLALAVMMR
jgi:hypothetical protein